MRVFGPVVGCVNHHVLNMICVDSEKNATSLRILNSQTKDEFIYVDG